MLLCQFFQSDDEPEVVSQPRVQRLRDAAHFFHDAPDHPSGGGKAVLHRGVAASGGGGTQLKTNSRQRLRDRLMQLTRNACTLGVLSRDNLDAELLNATPFRCERVQQRIYRVGKP